MQPSYRQELLRVAWLFLKLGTIAFGGPAAHVAIMEDEVVRRRKWLTHEEFLDLLAATNLIPGPNSTEMAIHIGHRRAGWPGLIVAGACFILPAAILVTIIAWAYVTIGELPKVEGVLYGIKPVIIAVVLQALWRLGASALKSTALVLLGMIAALLNLFGAHELLVLLGAGLLMASIRAATAGKAAGTHVSCLALVPAVPLATATVSAGAAAAPFGLWPLFLFFLKIGSVLFGSGYVLLAFLRSDLVTRWHWLTENQLLDAIAVGQFTPGPVFTTATFIGYVLAGVSGASVATIGIFLPAFFFVAISGPLVPRLRRSPIAGEFLDGVNVASLALMAVVTLQLGRVAIVDWLTLLLTVLSCFLLFRFKLQSVWLIAAGALAGLIRSTFAQ